uniref:NADH-ubiquinone oxidoreductase chain 3 n=22 Tax=Erythropitta TaxID=1316415 RepID=M9SX62_9PASS|nr:NADH dehydrogenase subunit 3 [Erythropitta erythrogaster aruensis]AGI96188.1 NADH dehydrogenase subunit 3 [Erythropitta erythrogaster bernsteini]AGI96191.1 NADH dehydrogenase subunit 3 [Erythropitta erythrogaster caeruleitorques]AGI96203.1 NADH dehydrogenase subunit 3 [Erythropitta erythrogaster cyanonota]AGI96205.1 NADH dehydrogenase subunit 3 [Erythropitta erythrogaster digglesi]AGI96207.1 NADH dehydrogenase subunit 3 [Erythropitta erythrogaster dohertyi]AGI96222.1 NADH dehydrogenase sub
MNTILSTLTLSMTITTLLIMLNLWLPQTNPDSEKLSPYECGFDPLGTARLPFSIRFFLVAILFLLFDLEIALLLPLPWATQLQSPSTTLMWTSTIILLLTLGLVYEWLQGGLEWAE